MKKIIYSFWIAIIALTSCNDDNINLFDKSAAQRTAEAIAALKDDLVSPSDGWRVKYTPTEGVGSFNVLMQFNEDNTVILKTDLASNNGEFFEDTITYRIDSSLGLELIMESYCFFSFLFEQDQATFGAEYEFLYANKTPDGELVFTSKTDVIDPTILLFEEAEDNDEDELLGQPLAANLATIGADMTNFTPSYKLTYTNKDVVFYLSMDEFRRTINLKSASKKNGTQVTAVDFNTTYILKGDSVVFDEPFARTLLSTTVTIKGIKFNTLTPSSINICASPINTHAYSGVTSANDQVSLESTLTDVDGIEFVTTSDFYIAPLTNIFLNGQNQGAIAEQEITGALAMQLYYNNAGFYGIGFVIQNANGTITFALREFIPVLVGNKLQFNLSPDISIFGEPDTDADVTKINKYVDGLTQGGNTFVFKYQEGLFEFYNPCTGWSVGFQPVL